MKYENLSVFSKRPFLRVLATILSVLILVTSLSIGSIVSTSAWEVESGARIYFDASKANFSGDNVYFMVLWNQNNSNGDWWQSYTLPMSEIGTSKVYTLQTYDLMKYSGNEVSICFFSADSWGTGYGSDIKQYLYIVNNCGGGYTNTLGINLYNNKTYYISSTSSTPYAGIYCESGELSGSSQSDPSLAINSTIIYKHPQSANVYTKETSDGVYSYVGDGNDIRGGTVSVQARTWSGAYSIPDSLSYAEKTPGGATSAGDYITYQTAARGTECTVTVESVYPGYTFDGWYWNDGTPTGCTDLSYTYTPITCDTEIHAYFHKTDYTATDYFLTGWLNGDGFDNRLSANKFEETSSGIYTLTYRFTDDEYGYQYPTIYTNNGIAYHPTDDHLGSGSSADPDPDSTPVDDSKKWMVHAPADRIVTFTWNTNNHTLSWAINAELAVTYEKSNNVVDVVYLPGGALRDDEISGGINLSDDENELYWKNQAAAVVRDHFGSFMQEYNIVPDDINVSLPSGDGPFYQLNVDIQNLELKTKKVTVTAYYPTDATAAFLNSGDLYYQAGAAYGETNNYDVYDVVNLAGHVSLTAVPNTYNFYAWMEYDTVNHTIGKIVSTKKNFNYKATGDKTIIAVFKDGAVSYVDKWTAHFDENRITAKYTSSSYSISPSSGRYYNNFIARFTNYGTNESLTEFATDKSAEYGVLMIYKPESLIGTGQTLTDACNTSTNADNHKNYITRLNNGKIGSHNALKIKVVELDASSLSNFNRVNLVLNTDVAAFKNAEYGAIAYLKYTDGVDTEYIFSDPVYGSYN